MLLRRNFSLYVPSKKTSSRRFVGKSQQNWGTWASVVILFKKKEKWSKKTWLFQFLKKIDNQAPLPQFFLIGPRFFWFRPGKTVEYCIFDGFIGPPALGRSHSGILRNAGRLKRPTWGTLSDQGSPVLEHGIFLGSSDLTSSCIRDSGFPPRSAGTFGQGRFAVIVRLLRILTICPFAVRDSPRERRYVYPKPRCRVT